MGLAHGGLRQKNFNAYEESLRIPLAFSNRRLFPEARRTEAMVLHVDFLPTLATLVGAPREARADWQGRENADVVLDAGAARPQHYVVFTRDDWQAGQANGPYLPPPNHIVCIRDERWKLARYYVADGPVPPQWEMHDLLHDPLERVNLAWHGHRRTEEQEEASVRLRAQMEEVERTRLAPLPRRA